MSLSYNKGASTVNLDRDVPSAPIEIHNTLAKRSISQHLPSALNVAVESGGKTRITCPLTVVNGLDFLKVSFWLDWDSNNLLRELENLKTVAQSFDNDSIPFHAPGGFDWNLHRAGTSQYTFRLTSGDLTFLLNTRQSDGVVPTARLEIGSLSCWSPGFFTIYERMILWLKALGASIVKETVSEVHLAADFINTDITSLGIANEDRWVSRVHKFNTHNDRRKLSGITLGKGDIMLRIYDKVLELNRSQHKQEVFAEIWGVIVYNQLPVTRVEFQIRRTVLNEFEKKIVNVNSLLCSLQSLWTYCTQSWSRFCENSVNRNHNQSKAINSIFWNTVSSINWTGIHTIERKKRRKNKNIDQLRANMRGMAMSLGAFDDANPEDLDHIIGFSQKLLAEDLTRLYKEDIYTFTERMKRKRNEIYVNI
jgi:hypothetical protein